MAYLLSSPPRRRTRSFLAFLVISIVITDIWPSLLLRLPESDQSGSFVLVPRPSQSSRTTASSRRRAPTKVISNAPVVAYAVTVTHCGFSSEDSTSTWKQGSTLQNAAAVFQRSVQLNSLPRNPRARYGSKLYAFIYKRKSNEPCIEIFEKLGYTVLVRDVPVDKPLYHVVKKSFPKMQEKFPEIEFRPRPYIFSDGCCGARELLKLRLYQLIEHPVVVHLDLDSLLLQPLDELFDAMILPAESSEGQAARKHLINEKLIAPTFNHPLPQQINSFYTKDWCASKAKYSKWVGVQGGFLVARPSLDVYEHYKSILSRGNYTVGYGAGSGWESSGYGRQIVGSMTFQGLVAYYYDLVNPTGIELHRCKFNQMADNPRETNTKFPRPSPLDPVAAGYADGECRDGRDNCDDVQCETWPLEDARSVHFTSCLKPWDCPDPILWNNTLVEQNCRKLHWHWYRIRVELEGDSGKGSFEPEMFLGFCSSSGSPGYIPMQFN